MALYNVRYKYLKQSCPWLVLLKLQNKLRSIFRALFGWMSLRGNEGGMQCRVFLGQCCQLLQKLVEHNCAVHRILCLERLQGVLLCYIFIAAAVDIPEAITCIRMKSRMMQCDVRNQSETVRRKAPVSSICRGEGAGFTFWGVMVRMRKSRIDDFFSAKDIYSIVDVFYIWDKENPNDYN